MFNILKKNCFSTQSLNGNLNLLDQLCENTKFYYLLIFVENKKKYLRICHNNHRIFQPLVSENFNCIYNDEQKLNYLRSRCKLDVTQL